MARGRKGRKIKRILRKIVRKYRRKPKMVVIKKYANTVGQILAKKHTRKMRPSHGRRNRHHRRHHRR